MNARTTLLFSALALTLTACRQPTPRRAESHDLPSHDTHAGKLELNHGQKWVVPQPMLAHIRAIEKNVRELEARPVKNHAALAAAIREQLGGLVTKCTMEGKAHDEMHKWLMPFLALSEDYFKATEPHVQQAKFRDIQRSLVVFNEYFE